MARERLNPQSPIAPLLARRWSPQALDAERGLDPGQVNSLLEAARWAPSCYGEEPWRFVVCDHGRDPESWERVLACLAPKNQRWARRAQLLIAAVAKTTFARDGKPNRWAGYDTGQAAICLCLQATAMGLAAHQMGGFDQERLRAALEIPVDFVPMSVIAVGHPASATAVGDECMERETMARVRKPLETIARRGAWGEAWRTPAACRWEARYRENAPEQLPWFHAGLDPDHADALERRGITSGRVLELGCGPGTQTVALARRGLEVTATDISPTAVAAASSRARAQAVQVEFLVDDLLQSKVTGTFDLVFDRGVFHCFATPGERTRYHDTVLRLLRPGGLLLLKCFHKREQREEGPPGRYDAEDIRRLLPGLELVEHRDCVFTSRARATPPRALFCVLKKT